MTHTTKPATPTPTHFTLPAILPAILTGLFILTACGGSALTNDAPIATNTQNDRCADNPLANGCQAGAGFLSVNFDEDIGDQEAESSEAPTSPSTQSAPAVQPVGSTETSPKSEPAVAGQQSAPAPVTAATAFTALPTERDVRDIKGSLVSSVHTGDYQNQFLQGGTAEIHSARIAEERGFREPPTQKGEVRYPLGMTLAEAKFDGAAIGGDASDGIDFFATTIAYTMTDSGGNPEGGYTINRYHYAGILSGTDLGAPVATSGETATWNGSFRTYNTNPVDFQLTVGFGATNPERTISAFVKDGSRRGDYYYLLAGTYTDAGLITGTVNWGVFTGGLQNAPVSSNNGILKGLIGAEGAVGTFISGSAVDANGKVTGGTGGVTAGYGGRQVRGRTWGLEGYVGGFVASASLPDERVTYRDWAESFDVAGTRRVETPSARAGTREDETSGDDLLFNQFLTTRDDATALDETGAGTITERGGLTLADDADSGVSFFSNGISLTTLTAGSQSYAGLLAGTSLGAPINDANQVGEWQGQFKSVGGYYYGALSNDTRVETALDLSFTLTVTFGTNNSVEAFVPIDANNRYFYITGDYNDKGVITGDVQAGFFSDPNDKSNTISTINGVLTGLIGQAGAVGAFHSNVDNYNYAGGFVAAPTE